MELKRWPTTVALIGLVMLGQSGCGVKHIGRSSSEELRDGLGVVGVSPPRGKTAPLLATPTSGKGAAAATGATGGAIAGAQVGGAILKGVSGCGGGGSIGAVVCGTIALFGLGVTAAGATIGALGGVLHGVINAEAPSSEIGAVLKSIAAELHIENALRDDVLEAAMRLTTVAVVATPIDPSLVPRGPEIRQASETGPDTILEVALESLRLTREGPGANPPVRFVAIARARLIGTADGRELYRHTVTHRSDASEQYDQWAADEGRLFKETVAAAMTSMADEIVNVLLLGLPAPSPPPPPPAPVSSPIPSPPTTAPLRATYDADASYREHCRQLHLMRSDWRHYLPAYERCLAR